MSALAPDPATQQGSWTEGGPPQPAPTGPGRAGIGLLLGVVLLVGAVLLSLCAGAEPVRPGVVWEALVHGGSDEEASIVREMRLPRTLIGAAVGAALGLAGAVMQSLTRNPLADPGLLGVNAGASAAVVTAISLLGVSSFSGYLWFAVGGAAVASVVVSALGGSGAATPVRLALAGTAVSAALSGYVNGLQLLDSHALDELRHWDVGSLAGRSGDLLIQAGPLLLVGAVLAFALARPLGVMAFGDDSARALGTSPGRTRVLSVVAVTLLSGGATAICGPIGFVGLMVPHAVRFFTGPHTPRLFVHCALYAPVLLLLSDVVGRVLAPPSEIQVGIITAFLGGVVFVQLVRRRKVTQL